MPEITIAVSDEAYGDLMKIARAHDWSDKEAAKRAVLCVVYIRGPQPLNDYTTGQAREMARAIGLEQPQQEEQAC